MTGTDYGRERGAELVEELRLAIYRDRLTYEDVARSLGVSRATLASWMQKKDPKMPSNPSRGKISRWLEERAYLHNSSLPHTEDELDIIKKQAYQKGYSAAIEKYDPFRLWPGEQVYVNGHRDGWHDCLEILNEHADKIAAAGHFDSHYHKLARKDLLEAIEKVLAEYLKDTEPSLGICRNCWYSGREYERWHRV